VIEAGSIFNLAEFLNDTTLAPNSDEFRESVIHGLTPRPKAAHPQDLTKESGIN
jgi:hypothetical protein